jgi:hypothetical protein
MKVTVRAAAAAAFLAALAAVGLSAYPSLAEEAGVDVWQILDDRRRLTAAEETDAALDRQMEQVVRRTALRREVVRDVVEGRATFTEGARRFAELNRTQSEVAAGQTRRLFPGRTAEETAALQLTSHLRAAVGPAAAALADECECVLTGRGAVTGRRGACE